MPNSPHTIVVAAADADRGPALDLPQALQAVQSSRAAGRTEDLRIVIQPGHYVLENPLRITPAMCGDGRLTIAGKGRVTLDAGRSIEGWRKCVNPPGGTPDTARRHVWEAAVAPGWFFAQLGVNGQLMPRAVSISTDEWRQWPTGQLAADQRELIVDPRVLPANDETTCAELNFLPTPYTRWSNAIVPVESVRPCEGRVRFAPTLFHRPEVLKDIPFRLENLAGGLTEPGRWFVDHDAGKVYIWPPRDIDMTTARVTAPFLDRVIEMTGDDEHPVRNVQLSGVRITGAGLKHISAEKPISRFGCGSTAVTLSNVDTVEISDCTFEGLSGNAVSGRGTVRDVTISRCTIRDCGGAGISISGSLATPDASCANNDIGDNVITDCGKLFWHSNAITAGHAEGTRIHHNYIHHMPYVAIGTSGMRHRWFANWPRPRPELEAIWKQFGDGRPPTVESVQKLIPGNNRIEHNLVHDVMQKLDDGGAIYCHAGKGNLVAHNVVCRTHSDSSHGLYFDDEEYGSRMEHNLVVDCPMNTPVTRGSSLHVHNNARNTIVNNIFFGSNRLFTFPASYGGHRVERNIFVFPAQADFHSSPAPVSGPGDGRRQPDWIAGASRMNHNLFWSADTGKAAKQFFETWRSETPFDQESVVTDPRFTAPHDGDFNMAEGPPAPTPGFKPFAIEDYGPRHLRLDARMILKKSSE